MTLLLLLACTGDGPLFGKDDTATDDSGGSSETGECPNPGLPYLGCQTGSYQITYGGAASGSSSWSYDDKGFIDAGESDSDGDGGTDSQYDYSYDDNGNRTYELTLLVGGTGPYFERSHAYDGDDLQSSNTTWENNQAVNKWENYFYDADGLLERIDFDEDNDGKPEGSCTVSWEQRDEGLAGFHACDYGSGYAFESVLDERGNLVRQRWSLDLEGSWYQEASWSFDGDCHVTGGQVLVDEEVLGSNTWDELSYSYSYDGDGKLLEMTQSRVDTSGALTNADYVLTYSYECP